MRLVLLFLIAVIAMACSTNPVVGKWKAVRTYDPVRKQMVPVAYEAVLELSSDGEFKVTLPGEQRTGVYEFDESGSPHRFVATDSARRAVRGIYRVEGEKLTVRGTDDPKVDLEFLQSVDPSNDKTSFPTIELERTTE